MSDDDWSEDSASEDESGGLAARQRFMQQAKQSVQSSADHDMCPTCGKEVFMTEDRVPFKGAFFHKACFQCTVCHASLYGGSHVEHENKQYCQSCYHKHVRPKGYSGTGTLSSEQK